MKNRIYDMKDIDDIYRCFFLLFRSAKKIITLIEIDSVLSTKIKYGKLLLNEMSFINIYTSYVYTDKAIYRQPVADS